MIQNINIVRDIIVCLFNLSLINDAMKIRESIRITIDNNKSVLNLTECYENNIFNLDGSINQRTNSSVDLQRINNYLKKYLSENEISLLTDENKVILEAILFTAKANLDKNMLSPIRAKILAGDNLPDNILQVAEIRLEQILINDFSLIKPAILTLLTQFNLIKLLSTFTPEVKPNPITESTNIAFDVMLYNVFFMLKERDNVKLKELENQIMKALEKANNNEMFYPLLVNSYLPIDFITRLHAKAKTGLTENQICEFILTKTRQFSLVAAGEKNNHTNTFIEIHQAICKEMNNLNSAGKLNAIMDVLSKGEVRLQNNSSNFMRFWVGGNESAEIINYLKRSAEVLSQKSTHRNTNT